MTEQNQQRSLLGKIAAYTEILAKDPKSTIFVSLSEAYRKMGMLDDARQVVEVGLGGHPDFSPAHIVLARILCQQGEYNESETSFEKAIYFDSKNLAALVGYSRLNILLNKEEKARELLLEARNLSPADPIINKLLLSLPQESSVVTPEVEIVTEVEVSSQPSPEDEYVPSDYDHTANVGSPLASSTLADLYLKQGLTQQALDVYRQLSDTEPDNLLFRRKIRDLEDELNGVGGPQVVVNTEVEVESQQSTQDTVETIDDELVDVSCAETVLADSCQTQADDKLIATLNRWLVSIQQRRENV